MLKLCFHISEVIYETQRQHYGNEVSPPESDNVSFVESAKTNLNLFLLLSRDQSGASTGTSTLWAPLTVATATFIADGVLLIYQLPLVSTPL